METTADKIAKAQNHFGTNQTLTTTLNQHMQSKNFSAYSNEFSTAAKNHGIELTSDEVSTHFGFKNDPNWKAQVKDTVKDEAKGAAKDEATGRVEDELSNQLGMDVSGVGGAAEEVGGFFKKLFGKKK